MEIIWTEAIPVKREMTEEQKAFGECVYPFLFVEPGERPRRDEENCEIADLKVPYYVMMTNNKFRVLNNELIAVFEDNTYVFCDKVTTENTGIVDIEAMDFVGLY